MNRNPSLKDYQIYKSFLVLVTFGDMASADQLMVKGLNKRAVYRIADDLVKKIPPTPKPLYRGLLLDPNTPQTISTKHAGLHRNYSFVSFSEDFEVACWFARSDSMISETYSQQNPNYTGWIATYTPADSSEYLFHWSWADLLNQDYPNLYQVAENIAVANGKDPADWIHQIHWNLKSQFEVILKPGADINLVAVDAAGCPLAPILDLKLTQRPDFVTAPPGLGMGTQPGDKLYLQGIELPKPPKRCPVCNQLAINKIYKLKTPPKVKVMICSACPQKSFVL